MIENIIKDLIEMEDEPVISEENETLLQQITSITRTAEFEPMGISEEKLDELIESLGNQETFSEEVSTLSSGLEKVKSIVLENFEDEEDYI